MRWRELKQRIDALPADVLDQAVLYVEPYDDRVVVEPDFLSAVEDIADIDGRPRIRAGQALLG